MSAILISRRIIRGFSSFKHFISPRYEFSRIPKLQAPVVNLSFVRSAQKAAEVSPDLVEKVDSTLLRIDAEIKRFGRVSRRQVEDVLCDLKDMKYASSTQSLFLIRCFGGFMLEEPPEERNQLVQEFLDTLNNFNIGLDVSHYNALLKVYIDNNHDFSPIDFLSNLEKSGIQPNRVTYQRLITRYCNLGDIEGATKILEFMKDKGLPINEKVFNSLIIGHARANDLESAHGVLGVMKAAGLTPGPDAYMNLMIGYAEKADLEGIARVEEECATNENELQNREYMEVIYSLASNGHSQHVSNFVEKLENAAGYNYDISNLIIRLINADCEEVAYQMLETVSIPVSFDGEYVPSTGSFFLKQIIRTGKCSVAKVLEYCHRMKREGRNVFALVTSLRAALSLGKSELALALMQVLGEEGAPLRPHYFWPLLVHYRKQGDIEMFYQTIGEMVSNRVSIEINTGINYIIPLLMEMKENEMSAIFRLKELGVPVTTVVCSFIAHYLRNGDIKSSVKLLKRFRVKVPYRVHKDLLQYYIRTGDATQTAELLNHMAFGFSNKASPEPVVSQEDEVEDAGPVLNQDDIVGKFLLDVCSSSNLNTKSSLVSLLTAMRAKSTCFGKEYALAVKNELGDKLTAEIIGLLDELSSDDLFSRSVHQILRAEYPVNEEEAEQLSKVWDIKNVPLSKSLCMQLQNFCRMNNVAKAEEVKAELDRLGIPYRAGTYVKLIEMYADDGQVEKALAVYKEFREKLPDRQMTGAKTLKLVSRLIAEGMFEECVKILQENALKETFDEFEEDKTLRGACTRTMYSAVKVEDMTIEILQHLYDTLVQNNFMKASSYASGALVQFHLDRNDLASAMEKFEELYKEYGAFPAKITLMSACIIQEDSDKLQRIMDISTETYGELNSLFDLIFAFISCGKVKQAQKIAETPGLRAVNSRMKFWCHRFFEKHNTTALEDLITVSKDIFDVDRNMMFSYLLKAYIRSNDCDKALDIWTTMQEESLEPSQEFLIELGSFLKNQGRDIPFVMPTLTEVTWKSPKAHSKVAVKKTNIEKAQDIMKGLDSSDIKIPDRKQFDLISSLLNDSEWRAAAYLAHKMIAHGNNLKSRILSRLFDNLASEGDVESIKLFEEFIDKEMISDFRAHNFPSLLCRAYIKAGRTEEFFDQLESLLSGPEVDTELFIRKFPFGTTLKMLQNTPEYLPKILSLAEKSAEHGIVGVSNCVWLYYLMQGLHTEAKEVYDKYIDGKTSRLYFRPIIRKALLTKDTSLLPPLAEVLNSNSMITSTVKGAVYSCWINVLCTNEQYDEAQGVLEGSLKTLELEDYSHNALLRLQKGLTASDKPFPYVIPVKVERNENKQESSSSSSSSSDER